MYKYLLTFSHALLQLHTNEPKNLSPDLLTQCTQHAIDHVGRYVGNRELLWVGGEIQPALGNKLDKYPEGLPYFTNSVHPLIGVP